MTKCGRVGVKCFARLTQIVALFLKLVEARLCSRSVRFELFAGGVSVGHAIGRIAEATLCFRSEAQFRIGVGVGFRERQKFRFELLDGRIEFGLLLF